MPLYPAVSEFADATRAFRSAMIPSFSFLAFKQNDRWEIFRARFTLNLPMANLQELEVHTANVRAGFKILAGEDQALERHVEALLGGSIEIGGDTFHFPTRMGGGYGATFIPLHAEGIASQNRVSVLQIVGSEQGGHLAHVPWDWELRAASEPFGTVAELIDALGLPQLPQIGSLFEAVAFNFVAIDNASRVDGTNAHFGVRLCKGLDQENVSVGYKILSPNAPTVRARIDGKNLKWSEVDNVELGEATLEVPTAALIHAHACYAGTAYNSFWFSDPDHSQNPRRASYEASDKGLEKLEAYLRNAGKQARDLEVAVAWLFWLLGFNPVHLGNLPQMSNAADVLAATPQGHFAVIECTTGVLKADHKLTHLVNRSAAVRAQLAHSNYQQLHVLPVIFTTKTREEVAADLGTARELGVAVITQDEITELLLRTLLLPNADELYAQVEKSLQDEFQAATEPQLF